MRKIVGAVAFIFAVSLFYGAFSQNAVYAKEYKIGYVDLAKVFDEYKKTKESEKAMDEKGKAKEAERKKYVDELKKLKDEQAILSDKAKAEKQGVIEAKTKDLQEFRRKSQEEFVTARNDILGEVNQDLEKTVSAYAKEAGYNMILDSRVVLYGSDKDDCTNEILSRLNKPQENNKEAAKK